MRREAFETLVERAVAALPEEFLCRLENINFLVEDWADAETLAEIGFEDPRDLLGYYRGWPLTERGPDYGNCLPDLIILYQKAVESYVAETGDPVFQVVFETIVHEVAHYFGFSEEEMDGIEDLWAGGVEEGS